MEKDHPKDAEIGRILGFSDGIFAFAITLLALTFDVPRISQDLADKQLFHEIFTKQIDSYTSFLISFIVIGSFWISHHQKFKYIVRYNKTFLWINLFALMCIVYLPYPTEVLSDYADSKVAVIFYALSMVITSTMFALIWVYATWHHKLVEKDLPRKLINLDMFYSFLIPALFLASIGLSFISLDIARYSWALIWIAPLLMSKFLPHKKD